MMRTRSVRLRPVRTADADWLYELLTSESGTRWRYRGRTPNPAEFAQDLWRGVHAQFVVTDRMGAPAGLVGTYNANVGAGHCHLFAVGTSDRGPLVTEAAGLVVNWVFDEFDFHKVWVEAAEFNLAQFASLTDVADVEGRLTNYDFWRGRYWDVLVLSINRQRWDEHHRGVLERRACATGACGGGRLPAVDELHSLLVDRLPLDSLAAVELVTDLEERLETDLDVGVLDGLGDVDAMAAAVTLHRRLADPVPPGPPVDQQSSGNRGRSPSTGHEPSSVAITMMS